MGGRGAKSTNIPKSLGKINGEEIESFSISGEEQGEIVSDIRSLREVYEELQRLKAADRKNHLQFGKDEYSIDINTATTIYSGYKLRKYKNKLKLT